MRVPLLSDAEEGSSTSTSAAIPQHRLFALAAEHWRWLTLGCAALVLRLPFSIIQPHLVSVGVLGGLMSGEIQQIKRSILLFIVAGAVDAFLDFWCVFLFSFTKSKIVRNLRNRLFSNIIRQEAGFFDNARTGDIMSRLSSDTVEMANDLTWVFRFSIEAVARIAGVVVYMFVICPRLAVAACVAIPVVAIGNKYYGSWLHSNTQKVQSALAAANAHAAEIFAASNTVFSFAAEKLEEKRYAAHIHQHYIYSVWQAVADGLYYMVFSTFLMQVAVQGLILIYGSRLVLGGKLKVEELISFLMYRSQLQEWTSMLLNSFSSLIKCSGASQQVFCMLDRVPQFHPSMGCQPLSSAGHVIFHDVYFAYPTRPSAVVLRGLTFEAKPGTMVALTGPSGAGKSTCFHLIEHFYEPTAGKVLLDGVSIADLDHSWLHSRVGLVGQEPILFSGEAYIY